MVVRLLQGVAKQMDYNTIDNENQARIIEIISELTDISKDQIEKAILKHGFSSVLEKLNMIAYDYVKLNDLITVIDFINREE